MSGAGRQLDTGFGKRSPSCRYKVSRQSVRMKFDLMLLISFDVEKCRTNLKTRATSCASTSFLDNSLSFRARGDVLMGCRIPLSTVPIEEDPSVAEGSSDVV